MLETIRRILLTGGEAEFVKAVSRHLRREGFSLEETCDYTDARRKIENSYSSEGPFDLVIMERAIPTTETYEFWGWIKKNHPETSVLLLSGIGSHDRVAETIRPEMDGHSRKPVTPKQMMALIRTIDRNRRRISSSQPDRSVSPKQS